MLRDQMRAELVKTALARRTITYGELMSRFGLARGAEGETVVGVLGQIDKAEALARAPGFAAIVVRKDTGFPGGGFFCWEGLPPQLRRPNERSTDPRLSKEEMEYVKREQERIWAYYHDHRAEVADSLDQARIDD